MTWQLCYTVDISKNVSSNKHMLLILILCLEWKIETCQQWTPILACTCLLGTVFCCSTCGIRVAIFYVFVCYPMASMTRSWKSMFSMIISTIVAQFSLVGAGEASSSCTTCCIQLSCNHNIFFLIGFYAEVPSWLAWMCLISPVSWTYRSVL